MQHATSTLTATANLTQKYTTADTEFDTAIQKYTVYRNIQYTEYDTKQFAKMLFRAETLELSLTSFDLSFEF